MTYDPVFEATEQKCTDWSTARPHWKPLEQGKWYFWDETEADLVGPWDTEEISRAKLVEYCKLLSEPET